jgi:RNA polymerase sigma factor (sigma-70 family)
VDRTDGARVDGESAFRGLVDRCHSDILAVTRALTQNENETELAQKIFVRAYQNLGRRDESLPMTTWLYQLVFRECVFYSRVTRFRRLLHSIQIASAWESGKYMNTGGGSQGTKKSAILAGLQALSAKARVLLLLREVAHRSVSELAQIVGHEESVVRRSLLTARHNLLLALCKNAERAGPDRLVCGPQRF